MIFSNNRYITMTTFEREMKDQGFKDAFEREYEDFLISELLCQAMDEQILIRRIAREARNSLQAGCSGRAGD